MIHLGAWAILPAAILGFLVGGFWYGPLLGKAWQAARGLSDAQLNSANVALIFGLTFLLNLFSAAALAHVMDFTGLTGLHYGVMIGGVAALGFIIPAMGVNYLFARLPLKLFLIDAGYWLVIYVLMGVLLGLIL